MDNLYREVICINTSNMSAKIIQIVIKRVNIIILYITAYPNIFYSIVMENVINIISKLSVEKQLYSMKKTTQFSFCSISIYSHVVNGV